LTPTDSNAPQPLDDILRTLSRTSLALLPIAAAVPIALDDAFLRMRPGRPSRLFELLGAALAVGVLLAAARALAKYRPSVHGAVPVLGFLLVVFHGVQTIGPRPVQSWDFQAYAHAADAVQDGVTPYPLVNPYYTYPPPFAHVMSGLASGVQLVAGVTRERAWPWVFYLCEIVQIALLAAAYVLLLRPAIALGLDATRAAVIVALLLIVNTPVLLTFALVQVNILIVVLVLAGVAIVGRGALGDAMGGLLLTCAGFIKLYPFALVPLWAAAGRRRAAAWSIGWAIAIVAITRPWREWTEFVELWLRPAVYPTAGDSTIFNVFANGARFLGLVSSPQPPPAIRFVWLAIVALVSFWAVRRIALRLATTPRLSLFVCTAEVLALTLFVSPLVWPHHFVYVLPLTVVAAATVPSARQWHVAIAALLMFAMPWSDFFGFGYHRLIGLGLLLWACRPERQTIDPALAQPA